jgi:hypothetical protein
VIIVFGINISKGIQDPLDIWYAVIATCILLYALRPNLKKLITGQERVVKYSLNGWLRARKAARLEAEKKPDQL